MKINKYKFLSLIIGFIAIGGPLIYSKIKYSKFKKMLMKDNIIVSGEIIGYRSSYKRTDVLSYKFSINDKDYYHSSSSYGKSDDYKRLYPLVKGKTFPIIVCKTNPKDINSLLLVPEDFKEFGLQFPDSLNWIKTNLKRFSLHSN
jgi:hypothetical protein